MTPPGSTSLDVPPNVRLPGSSRSAAQLSGVAGVVVVPSTNEPPAWLIWIDRFVTVALKSLPRFKLTVRLSAATATQ